MRTLFPSIPRPLLFGHRGFSELAPENTMKAFELCMEKGIGGIELDVHLCKSGELVVIHDHNLQRLAGIDAQVEDLTLEELLSLDVGSHKDASFTGERIPTLEEVFTAFGSSFYYDIELKVGGIKDTHIARKTWQIIRALRLEEHVLVSSFNPFAIRYFNQASEHRIPTAVIYCESQEVPKVLQHGWGRHIAQATVLKPEKELVTEKSMRKFSVKKGYPVLSWTVDDRASGIRLLQLGVDGLITNNPGLFTDLMHQR